MGQDRQFTDEEKSFALNTLKRFREAWEKEERDNLTADRDRKLGIMGEDKETQDKAEEEATQAINDQMETLILSEVYFDKELVDADEELHEIETRQKTLTLQSKRFSENPEWKLILENIKSFRVMKMPHII